MQKLTFFLLFGCLLTLVPGCKSKKVATADEFEGRKISLTTGGGFTGQMKTWVLLENGQLFKQDGNGLPFRQDGSIDKKIFEQLLSNYYVLKLDQLDLKKYGNVQYALSVETDGSAHDIKWEKGMPNTEMLQTFFTNTMNLIRKHKVETDDSPDSARK